MNIALKYTLRVWQTAVFVAPVFILMLSIVPSEGASDAFFIYLIGIVAGFIWSIPSFLFLAICAFIVSTSRISITSAKAWLTVAGLALSWLPFYMLDGVRFITDDDTSSLYFISIYAIVIVISIWMFRLETQANLHTSTN
ncbi:hypothetical protein IM792_11005 [Mucilaginibacter sp. JRF]|uniref:hypothetical protein n=1 Tax=Mucilaginibacter sp. JRF TaxID=2780088 RepID=UPI0018809A10|nr:hypothetical protein [Mucilaginibacter sp. JRF]MBE9584977.1 hypothetical protein [Mucilaginibacter sp. JRF]